MPTRVSDTPTRVFPGSPRPALARTQMELEALLADPPGAPGGLPALPATGRARRAVVMTMGALHAGHADLVRAARASADQVVVTIFVNPLQFAPGEDFSRYPRTLDTDVGLCAREGVDVVFAPEALHAQPPLVRVQAGPLGDVLEGAARPGHFTGVLTVVATLLHLTRPDVAFFGRKDAQQLICIRRMVADLGFGVQVVGVPTVRDPDGLALSSRNAYLTTPQRRTALALPRALAQGVAVCDEGAEAVLYAAGAVLAATSGLDIEYLTLADTNDLRPVRYGNALLLVAAKVGSTRLIDNIEITLPDAPVDTAADPTTPARPPFPFVV